MRTERDIILDTVLLLYLLDKAGEVQGNLKVQKTTFLTELELRDHGMRGPHFCFFRYHCGPFSRTLWDTIDQLVATGFLRRSTMKPTERGRFLLNLAFPELREKNEAAFTCIDTTLARYHGWTGERLMRHVYELEIEPDDWPGTRMRVADMPMNLDILIPAPGGLIADPWLAGLLLDELSLTEGELEQARRDFPATEQRALNRLRAVLSAAEQS